MNSTRFRPSYPAAFIVAATILGGGTTTSLTTDFILGLMALPFIWHLTQNFPAKEQNWSILFFILAVVTLFSWQLLPSFGQNNRLFSNTADAGRTLEAALITTVLIAVFYYVLRMQPLQRERLLLWFIVGVGINFLVSFLQFSSSNFMNAVQPFSYSISAGFFANENHLSSLFVIAVPILIALFRKASITYLSIPLIILIIFFQLVVGSRAGVLMIFASAYISFAVIIIPKLWLKNLALIVGVSTMVFFMINNTIFWENDFALDGTLSRGIFIKNTIQAIIDHLPMGSGFGSFTLVYPKYELATGIAQAYVNHVHNDFLELVLEGGLLTVGLIVWYIILFLNAIFRKNLNDIQKAAGIAIFFLLLHSSVDYPLRTLALAIPFTIFTAIIFSNQQDNKR